MRQALWITRFDWETERELRTLVQRAIEAGITDILMQARAAGDAFYRSAVVPASPRIAGRLGGQMDWDPLETVCTMARDHDVRVHAWLNVLSGWPATSAETCAGLEPSPDDVPDHLLLRHAEA